MLPKIDLPIFEATLPSTGEKIKYRTFTVKEEKILLVAQQSEELSQTVVAIKQVVNNCLIDKNVEELAMFDLEYMLLHIRAKSVEEKVSFAITDPETEKTVNLEFNLDDVTVKTDPEHTNQVAINENYSLYLKYPTIDEFIRIATMDQSDPLINYTIMIACLDKVAGEDEVFNFCDYTEKEVDQFMEDVDTKVIKGIQRFFDTIPKMRHEIPYTNENGNDKTYVIEGINSFFF